MTPIITIKRLKIHHSYAGDVDGMVRIGRTKEKKAFEPDLDKIWSTINSKIQDVGLVKAGLVNEVYKLKIIDGLKAVCDSDSFDELTKGLPL